MNAPVTTRTQRRPRQRGDYDEFEPLFRELHSLPVGHPRRAELRDRLVMAHLPLAEHLARLYSGRGEPEQDLVQVATLGLIKAVNGYVPDFGNGFLPYAIPTIKGEVRRHFRDATWAMHVPRRLKELHMTLSRATTELSERLGRSPRPSELAEYLGISRSAVCDGLAVATAYRPASINRRRLGNDQPGEERGDSIGDLDEEFEHVEDAAVLRPAIRTLPERERRIIALRFFHQMTQSQIARVIGISQMHVSRLLAHSLKQLRQYLTEHPG